MGTTLLLADDSITIQKVVGIIFANEDYELVVVDNGDSALEKAREIYPDVMLVDAVMPGKSGYEVCEEVRRDPLLKVRFFSWLVL
jgi:CheY-like chemotaxis protein